MSDLPGYLVIGLDWFMAMLRRAHEGEDPDLLLAEVYANSEIKQEP